jgi:hypothetical protein
MGMYITMVDGVAEYAQQVLPSIAKTDQTDQKERKI